MSHIDELAAIIATCGSRYSGATAAQILDSILAGESPLLHDAVRRIRNLRHDAELTAWDVGQALKAVQGIRSIGVDKRKCSLYAPISNADLGPPRSVEHAGRSCDVGVDVRDGVDQQREKVCSEVDSEQRDPRKSPEPHSHGAPSGYHIRGVSTLLDGSGNVTQQWVKTTQDRDAVNLERLLEAIKSLPEEYRSVHEPVKPPESVSDDLLVVYPIGDPHLAMLAWAEETGANYDLKIAERLHVQAIKHLVAGAPTAKNALVVSLGDFFHVSNDLARTERSGNPLDTDSRFAKALRVGVRMFTAMIDAALTKHENVRVICEIGNHDVQASMMLALAMDAFYARDDRVTVDTSPSRFHYHRFGRCLFGTTHGDGAKADKLPMVMAQDRARDWGETRHRKWLVGHIHQQRVMAFPGCRVEHYRTLAGNDAWSHGEGYRSDRGMGAEYYHREHGFVGGAYVPLSLLEVA